MYRRQLMAAVALAALCIVLLLPPAFASVELIYFHADPTANNTIMLTWETATEREMVGFKVYRSLTNVSPNWVDIIPEGVPAQGTTQGGARYHFEDTSGIVPGTRYYYQLREINIGGELINLETASAGIGLPADTATPTATSTPTASPTWTRAAVSGAVPTTSTPLRPTATPRFTLAPPTAAPGTTAPRAGTPVATVRAPAGARTPLVGAQVVTPTGVSPRVTLPVAASPTIEGVVSTPVAVLPATPTPNLVALAEDARVESPTPLPSKDATPVIFSSAAEGSGSPTPENTEQVAGENGGGPAPSLVICGSAIGVAALGAALYLFLRSRRG